MLSGEITPGRGRFPETRHSVLAVLRDGEPEQRRRALEAVLAVYWKPVYTYLRVRWREAHENARDLTQEFFAAAVLREFLAGYDPARARFRTYLRVCLDRFVQNRRRDGARRKRGGGAIHLPLDFETADGELRSFEIPDPLDPDAFFRREWIRALFTAALETLERDLRGSDRTLRWEIFREHDIDADEGPMRPSYAEIAARHGVSVTKVTNELHAARKQFREAALARLRELTAGEEEFRESARDLFGLETGGGREGA